MIQIDMDMPKSCAVCRFNSRCDDCECAPNFCTAMPTEDDCHATIGYFRDGGHEYDPEIGFTPEYSRMEWCPLKEVETLTDKEQRIFLAAMGREEIVCKQVDDDQKNSWRNCMEPYEDSLVRTCHEIIRKVKGALWT